jgi:hypothetical protein
MILTILATCRQIRPRPGKGNSTTGAPLLLARRSHRKARQINKQERVISFFDPEKREEVQKNWLKRLFMFILWLKFFFESFTFPIGLRFYLLTP